MKIFRRLWARLTMSNVLDDYQANLVDIYSQNHQIRESTESQAANISLQLSQLDYDGPLSPEHQASLHNIKAEFRYLSELSILLEEQEDLILQQVRTITWRAKLWKRMSTVLNIVYLGLIIISVIFMSVRYALCASAIAFSGLVLYRLIIYRIVKKFFRRQRRIAKRQDAALARRDQERASGTP